MPGRAAPATPAVPLGNVLSKLYGPGGARKEEKPWEG